MIRLSKRDFGQIFIGDEGLDKSWQQKFPNNTKCCRCEGNSRIGFVYFEDSNQNRYVGSVHGFNNNNQGRLWPHDAIAVATYFCEKCLEPTSLYNQA